MIASGLDLGGTKIEAQVFAPDWTVAHKKRIETPQTYDNLVASIADLIVWVDTKSSALLPVGIGAAGLINPATGQALTANICANGRALPDDIMSAVGRQVTYLNDTRALALSEAVFGAGKGHRTVAGVIFGTGVGGGIAVDQALPGGPTMTGGEFGHCAAPAALIAQYGLPVLPCGCGRSGCIEPYVSARGLENLGRLMLGGSLTARDIAKARHTTGAPVWAAWCALAGDMMRNLILTVDPDVIVVGGGLSNIDGIIDDLTAATQAAQIADFPVPPIVLAEGGDASGARGAAYAAWRAAQ